jgi:protein ImuA
MGATARQHFSSSGGGTAARLDRLRRELWALETGLAGEGPAPLPLGIPVIDGALGGGLNCGALHEIATAGETATAAATGFALALAARPSSLRGTARNDESAVSDPLLQEPRLDRRGSRSRRTARSMGPVSMAPASPRAADHGRGGARTRRAVGNGGALRCRGSAW